MLRLTVFSKMEHVKFYLKNGSPLSKLKYYYIIYSVSKYREGNEQYGVLAEIFRVH